MINLEEKLMIVFIVVGLCYAFYSMATVTVPCLLAGKTVVSAFPLPLCQ